MDRLLTGIKGFKMVMLTLVIDQFQADCAAYIPQPDSQCFQCHRLAEGQAQVERIGFKGTDQCRTVAIEGIRNLTNIQERIAHLDRLRQKLY